MRRYSDPQDIPIKHQTSGGTWKTRVTQRNLMKSPFWWFGTIGPKEKNHRRFLLLEAADLIQKLKGLECQEAPRCLVWQCPSCDLEPKNPIDIQCPYLLSMFWGWKKKPNLSHLGCLGKRGCSSNTNRMVLSVVHNWARDGWSFSIRNAEQMRMRVEQ